MHPVSPYISNISLLLTNYTVHTSDSTPHLLLIQ